MFTGVRAHVQIPVLRGERHIGYYNASSKVASPQTLASRAWANRCKCCNTSTVTAVHIRFNAEAEHQAVDRTVQCNGPDNADSKETTANGNGEEGASFEGLHEPLTVEAQP